LERIDHEKEDILGGGSQNGTDFQIEGGGSSKRRKLGEEEILCYSEGVNTKKITRKGGKSLPLLHCPNGKIIPILREKKKKRKKRRGCIT